MSDSELAQLFIDLSGMFSEIKTDSTFFETGCDSLQTVGSSDIDAVYGTGIYDHNLGIFPDTVLDILLEDLYIGEEKVLTEPVDDDALNGISITVS